MYNSTRYYEHGRNPMRKLSDGRTSLLPSTWAVLSAPNSRIIHRQIHVLIINTSISCFRKHRISAAREGVRLASLWRSLAQPKFKRSLRYYRWLYMASSLIIIEDKCRALRRKRKESNFPHFKGKLYKRNSVWNRETKRKENLNDARRTKRQVQNWIKIGKIEAFLYTSEFLHDKHTRVRKKSINQYSIPSVEQIRWASPCSQFW